MGLKPGEKTVLGGPSVRRGEYATAGVCTGTHRGTIAGFMPSHPSYFMPIGAQVYNDKLYVFAGLCCQEYCSGDCDAFSKVQIYDVANDKWNLGKVC